MRQTKRLKAGRWALWALAASVPALGLPPGSRDPETLRAVLLKIEQNYVDQSRVDANRMLWGAAAALDREVPEVLLESQPGADTLRLLVAGESRSFPAASVRTLPGLSAALGDLLRFVDERRPPSADRAAAEYAAINGILATLDPHSILLNPAEARLFDSQVSSRMTGIGVVIDFYGTTPFVKEVRKGGPAAAAGVAACDRIIAVDGWPTAGASIDDLVGRIVGPADTEVWISFDRDPTGPRDLILIRQQIKLPSVRSRLLDASVGVIAIDAFVRGTASEVEAAIAELKKAGAGAWILDLRTNPGGLMSEAVKTVSLFVPSGPVVTTVGEGGRQREVKEAKREKPGPADDGPMAVLISPYSASASEIVAGALQNRNRAVLLGQISFGKGTVQVLFAHKDGSKLKLSVAHYSAPGGVSLQSRGVIPDIELVRVPSPRLGRVRLTEAEPEREADLDRAFRARMPAGRPDFSLQYVAATPDREEEVRIAGDLILGLPPGYQSRVAALERARVFVAERRATEEQRIVRVLGEAGVDWSPGPAGKAAKVVVRCAQRASASRAAASPDSSAGTVERVSIDCEVRNTSDADAFRVIGRAPDRALDLPDEEIVIGRVGAGESRRISLEGTLDKSPAARVTRVPFAFAGEAGAAVECAPIRIEAPARPRPRAPGGPEIRITGGAVETSAVTGLLRVEIQDRNEVRDAWVRVSNREARVDRKKVLYAARGEANPPDRLDFSAEVPLSVGSNEVEVCARGRDSQRCESAFFFREGPALRP